MTKQWSPDRIDEQVAEIHVALERLHKGERFAAETASAALTLLTLGTRYAGLMTDTPSLLTLAPSSDEDVKSGWMVSSTIYGGQEQLPADDVGTGPLTLRFHRNLSVNPYDRWPEQKLHVGHLAYFSIATLADIRSRGGELTVDPEAIDSWVERLNRPY